jgi:hypothetical protein
MDVCSSMKKWIIQVLLVPINLLSLTGGLLLQRKWRSAMTIAGAIGMLGLLVMLTDRIALWFLVRDTEALEVYHWLLYLYLAYLLLIGLAIILSSVILFRNTARVGGSLIAGVIAILMTIGAVVTTIIEVPKAKMHIRAEIFHGGRSYIPVKSREEYEAIRFHKHIDLKDAVLWGEPTFVVPSGDNKISGVVRYRGKPAIVSVKLFLNQYWRTRTVKTDNDGRFSFHVGPKNLTLNRMELALWFNKPKDTVERMPIVLNPHLKYSDTLFDHARYAGQLLLATGNPKQDDGIEIEIVDFIPMIWPQYRDGVQMANPESSALEWERVEGAAYYEVNIAHYTDEHSASPHRRMRVEENRLPLSSIPLNPASDPPKYYVEIAAFDQADRFLGSTSDGFTRMRFAIPGYKIVGNAPPPGKCK